MTHKRGQTLELYSLTEIQQFATTIFEAPDGDHIGRHTKRSTDVKNYLKIKKSVNFNISLHVRWCLKNKNKQYTFVHL